MVERPDFPSILPVKSDRFFACKSRANKISLIWALLKKMSSFCLSKVQKTSFIMNKRDDVTNGRRTAVPSRAVSGGLGVNGLNQE